MKRVSQIWPRFVSWQNLLIASSKARRRKRSRRCVLQFEFRREQELIALLHELKSHSWNPGPFTTHWISRPKYRLISAALYRDRVVHHAIMNLLEPILDPRLHPHSFACRRGKGTHAGFQALSAIVAEVPIYTANGCPQVLPLCRS